MYFWCPYSLGIILLFILKYLGTICTKEMFCYGIPRKNQYVFTVFAPTDLFLRFQIYLYFVCLPFSARFNFVFSSWCRVGSWMTPICLITVWKYFVLATDSLSCKNCFQEGRTKTKHLLWQSNIFCLHIEVYQNFSEPHCFQLTKFFEITFLYEKGDLKRPKVNP